jgi:hypothetical protein
MGITDAKWCGIRVICVGIFSRVKKEVKAQE